jgi:hypothetical protein
MIEDGLVPHLWGRCAAETSDDAVRIVKDWTASLSPSVIDRLPSSTDPFVHVFIGAHKDVALDLSMQGDQNRYLVGFGIRSGVPQQQSPR